MDERRELLMPEDEEEAGKNGIKLYSSQVAMAMIINYVVGTGCFGLPYAFVEGGYGLAVSILLVGGVLATVSMVYTLEIMARAEGVANIGERTRPVNRITLEKFDFTRIAQIFQGSYGAWISQAGVFFYTSGLMWSYASVFGSSVSSLFSSAFLSKSCDIYAANASMGCTTTYHFALAFFTAICLYLVLLNLSEQAVLQKFLSLYRMVAFTIMLVTLAWRVGTDPSVLVRFQTRTGSQLLFRWDKFGKAFGPCFLALNCHFNLPDVMQPLRDKSRASFIGTTAMAFVVVLYLLLAILGGFAFEQVSPLVSLNWSTYTGCGNGWDICLEPNRRAELLSGATRLVVLLFPVINVMSSFPMNGVTLGDNIALFLPESIERSTGVSRKAIARISFSLPPLILAALFKKLDLILAVAGLFGFILEILIPCGMHLASSKYISEKWDAAAALTPYNLPFWSSRHVVRLIYLIGFLALFIAVISIPSS
ncbi:hypothetical protein NDN08_005875 [Rhodosorus marinus]|uniref:Amino acid transporter transmembrane domain-containing protein n=1 Tax=Rhodosorus marinus TaxID=101924 RepID=A0AAV8V4S7_9RHOD|nr:hypothetical protein NDN08_005875 [Rhodosorus marinus]